MSITEARSTADRLDLGSGSPAPLFSDDRSYLTIHGDNRTLTHDDIVAEALRMVGRLTRRGVCQGERVLLKAQNSPEYLSSLLALMQIDCAIVLLDDGLSPGEVHRVAEITRARWLLADYDHDLELPIGYIGLDAQDEEPGPVVGDIEIGDWLAREDAVITWTSGTTGEPKAIVRSGPAVRDVLQQTQQRMGYREDDVLLPLVPFSHFYGLTLALLWWSVGCGLVVPGRVHLPQALRLGSTAGVTVVDGTPSTYYTIVRLLQARPRLRADLASVRMWCVGGAPLASTLQEAFTDCVGAPLLNGYGSSEAGNIAMADLEDHAGCGRILDQVQVRILDEEGTPVGRGAVGHIEVRSDSLMHGYLGQDGLPMRFDREAWFRTGDLGYWLDDGQLEVAGRELAVHRMGHTLYPDVIERKAEQCGVPVKVVALEDERRGSALVFVLESTDGRSSQEWRRELQQILPTYEQPNAVVIVPRHPLLGNGKVDMLRLRAMAADALPQWNDRLLSAQPTTADMLLADRAKAMTRVADHLESHRAELLELLTEVALYSAVDEEIDASIATLRGAKAEVEEHRPMAVDRVAVFMPSNVVLLGYVLNLLVPALYSREVIFRPSSQVADQTLRLHEMLAPVHGLPITSTQLSQRKFLNGPVADSDVVVFTGTYQNAEDVRAKLAPNQLFLFFGQGVNPFIVTDGADFDLAARDAVRIRLLNSGQDCFGPDVFLVPHERSDEFVSRLVGFVSDLRFGPNHDPAADYGPMVYESAIEAAADFIRETADVITHGGTIDFAHRHVQPTVVQWPLEEKKPRVEEVFSPIFNIVPYRNDEHLKEIVTSAYFADRSMGAMIYGDHPVLSQMLAKRHLVANNETLVDVDLGNEPFGGRGIMANYAAIGTRRVAEPILISKAVAEHMEWRG